MSLPFFKMKNFNRWLADFIEYTLHPAAMLLVLTVTTLVTFKYGYFWIGFATSFLVAWIVGILLEIIPDMLRYPQWYDWKRFSQECLGIVPVAAFYTTLYTLVALVVILCIRK